MNMIMPCVVPTMLGKCDSEKVASKTDAYKVSGVKLSKASL